MDNYSYDSDIIEPLAFLRPPVQKKTELYSVFGPSKKVQVLNLTSTPPKLAYTAKLQDSSTSLVLEKTSKTQILKQYSVADPEHQGSLENQLKAKDIRDKKEKPLIKVTVIPNCGKTESKLLRKRRLVTKTIQGTSSDHNNSIQTKNLYLVVAGRKEDKIYEIKTTGSAKFERDRHDSVEGRHNIFQSFAMDRKRKKEHKKDIKSKEKDRVEELKHGCNCCPGDGLHDPCASSVKPGKSRVKIFGKLGLTQNDKYVLKCQATINDKPVTSFLSNERLSYDSVNDDMITSPRSPRSGGKNSKRNEYHGESQEQRESIQPDYRLKAVNNLLFDIEQKYKVRKESQSTQVDLSLLSADLQIQQSNRVQNLHNKCFCAPEYPNISTHEVKNIKSCQSPLVIISVYPKHDNNHQLDFLKAVQGGKNGSLRETCTNNISTDYKNFREEGTPINPKVTKVKKPKSRSPSPKNRSSSPKSTKGKAMESKEFRQGRAEVRAKQGKVDQKTSTKQTLQFFNSKLNREDKLKTGSIKSRSKQNKTIGPGSADAPAKPSKIPTPKSKAKRKVEIGINTEHLQTKKALVDSYTKRILDQTNKDKPGLSISKVSVNIEGENEFYDVIFQHDKTSADLNVRKTMKNTSTPTGLTFPKRKERDNSVEKFFQQRSVAKTNENQSVENLSKDLSENVERLFSVRDSIEITHRRGEKSCKDEKGVVEQAVNPTRNTDDPDSPGTTEYFCVLVPVKHFPGDSCVVCDPIARDKEIRKLLGVTTRFSNITRHPISPGIPVSTCCYYPYPSNKPITTEVDLPKGNLYHKSCAKKGDLYSEGYLEDKVIKINRNRYLNIADNKERFYRQGYLYELKQSNGSQRNSEEILSGCCSADSAYLEPITLIAQNYRHKDCDCGSVCPDIDCKLPFRQPHLKKQKPAQSGITHSCSPANPLKPLSHKSISNQLSIASVHSTTSTISKGKVVCECSTTQNTQKEMVTKIDCHRGHHSGKMPNHRKGDVRKDSRESLMSKKSCKTVPNECNFQQCNVKNDVLPAQLMLNRNVQVFLQIEEFSKQKPIVLTRKQYKKVKKAIQMTLSAKERDVPGKQGKRCKCRQSLLSIGQIKRFKEKREKTSYTHVVLNQAVQTERSMKSVEDVKNMYRGLDTIVLFSNENPCVRQKQARTQNDYSRHAVSTLEVRYASIAFKNKKAFSSSNEPSIDIFNIPAKNSDSLETIFRGHRKSITPNLGTSALSLQSEGNISKPNSLMMMLPDAKTNKKTFLKRLIACLMMKSRASDVERSGEVDPPTSANSSVDSYHISTTFGAIEMTSSLYDTSASFYSDHGIHPLSSKHKRSFFSSVRRFLATRSKS